MKKLPKRRERPPAIDDGVRSVQFFVLDVAHAVEAALDVGARITDEGDGQHVREIGREIQRHVLVDVNVVDEDALLRVALAAGEGVGVVDGEKECPGRDGLVLEQVGKEGAEDALLHLEPPVPPRAEGREAVVSRNPARIEERRVPGAKRIDERGPRPILGQLLAPLLPVGVEV